MSETAEPIEAAPVSYPDGEYAIVEILGHVTLVGRVTEVERFGTKLMAVEAVFKGELLPAIFQGGSSIYRFTPCSAEIAFKRGPTELWHLPTPLRVIVPAALLPAPAQEPERRFDALDPIIRDRDDDGEMEF